MLLVAEAVAVTLTLALVTHEPPTASIALRFGLLTAMSIGYSEAAARSTRLQRYLGNDTIFANPMSVWSFAALLTIPAGWAAAFIGLQYSHALWQRRRDASGKPHRVLFTAAAATLAQLAAATLVDTSGALHGHLQAQLADAAAAPLFLAVDMAVLLTGMWLTVRPIRSRALIPDADTLGYELGTLVLGLATAQLVLHNLLLTPAVLVLVALLHRGNVVKSLRKLARTDAKTGLLAAAAWSETTTAALGRAARSGSGLAILLVDLDNFKAINDVHGHLAGDRVLAGVADCLRRELRGHDGTGRWGGDELVATLEDVTAAGALAIAQRLRAAIADLAIAPGIHVTASIGVAHTDTRAETTTVDALLECTDRALYAAKGAGRDQVCVAETGGRPMRQHYLQRR